MKEVIANKLATVIDVRTPEELSLGSFPGSINIPVQEIRGKIDEIKKMKGPIVFYCHSGNRSSMAIQILKSAGLSTEMYNGGGYYDMLTLIN